ncbi:unnamed protein product, partial [Symbiodinium necroappetens]
MQLYFTVKMKFQLEAILPDADLDDDGNVVEFESRETYLLSPAPWVVAPDADMERRLTSIVETAREKLEQHLEAAALRGSGDLIGGIRQVYILVVPRNFGFDFSTLPAGDRGVTWADIEEFERVNGHRLRIFVWEWHKVEWRQQTVYETVFERVVVREPKLMNHPFEKEIHLL